MLPKIFPTVTRNTTAQGDNTVCSPNWKRGSRPFIYTRSQHQKRLNIFGWVDLIQGAHGIMKWVSGNTDGFIQMLRKIGYRFKGKTIDLWVDNARWHKGARVKTFFTEYSSFHIHYLPDYHPELNYRERLWHTMRYFEKTIDFFWGGSYADAVSMRPTRVS